jgi:hypothetical protein
LVTTAFAVALPVLGVTSLVSNISYLHASVLASRAVVLIEPTLGTGALTLVLGTSIVVVALLIITGYGPCRACWRQFLPRRR